MDIFYAKKLHYFQSKYQKTTIHIQVKSYQGAKEVSFTTSLTAPS